MSEMLRCKDANAELRSENNVKDDMLHRIARACDWVMARCAEPQAPELNPDPMDVRTTIP